MCITVHTERTVTRNAMIRPLSSTPALRSSPYYRTVHRPAACA